MNPHEEFGSELEAVLKPFSDAVIRLAEALKLNPLLLKESEEFELFRVAADSAVHYVTGLEHKEILFDFIESLKKTRPDLKEQFEYIVKYEPI